MIATHRPLPALALLGLALVVGCGGKKTPPPFQFDGGSDASTDASTDGSTDASADSGADASSDGSMDASTDAGMDAATDGSVQPDAGPPVPVCAPDQVSCTGGCPTGTVCSPDLCGNALCKKAGNACDSDSDCAMGSTCVAGSSFGVCQATSGDCNDSRDCPAGYTCEGSPTKTCVDRRLRCLEDVDCPMSYVCMVNIRDEAPICGYRYRPCTEDKQCIDIVGVCTDADGDGDTECAPSGGMCLDVSDCTGTDRCGLKFPNTVQEYACGAYGPCADSSTCAPDFVCLDLAGRGQAECVPTGGTCTTTADCPVQQVCGVPRGGGAPRCMD